MAIYFASDFHLGLDKPKPSKEREKIIINWLDSIQSDAEEVYLLGDIFDYWFEYKNVVPKGYTRLLAKLAEFTDSGILVHVFTGNHDMWMFGYLEDELGIILHKEPQLKTIHNKVFLLGHGDGLGPGDKGYKFIKRIFSSKVNQWLFARIHPNTGIWLMKKFSQKSRESEKEVISFLGEEKERLVSYAEQKLRSTYFDYCIFGHRHLPIDFTLKNNISRYINTGDWFWHYSYVRFDGQELQLLTFAND
jgi:UDP-2,3-diacylglucosamine hydrolase